MKHKHPVDKTVVTSVVFLLEGADELVDRLRLLIHEKLEKKNREINGILERTSEK